MRKTAKYTSPTINKSPDNLLKSKQQFTQKNFGEKYQVNKTSCPAGNRKLITHDREGSRYQILH